MMTIDLPRLHADQAWVENLILTHIELQATRHVVFTTGQQVSVEVEGAHFEARAWRHAIDGRIMPSHIDQAGVRRQLVVGAHCQVEVVEHPCQRNSVGGINVGIAFIVCAVGLFLFAFSHTASTPSGGWAPDGRWVAGLAIVGAVVVFLATGITVNRRRERAAAARGEKASKDLKQDTSGDHYLDGMN